MESECALPCYNSPLSMSIPQSCGKRGDDRSNCFLLCLVKWIFLGMSAISASVPNVASFVPLWKVSTLHL